MTTETRTPMFSRFLCGVLAVAIAGPCFGQASLTSSRPVSERPAVLGAFGLTVAENLHVTGVKPGSAADEMGLKEGDAIRDMNGLGLGGPDEFGRALGAVPTGQPIRIAVSRNGSQLRLAGRMDRATVEAAAVRPVSQTVVKQDYPAATSNSPPQIVKGMSCSGCSNYGSSYASSYCTCGPCGYGPGTQYLARDCALRLDLSNGIGMCDPCNAWGPTPCYSHVCDLHRGYCCR